MPERSNGRPCWSGRADTLDDWLAIMKELKQEAKKEGLSPKECQLRIYQNKKYDPPAVFVVLDKFDD